MATERRMLIDAKICSLQEQVMCLQMVYGAIALLLYDLVNIMY